MDDHPSLLRELQTDVGTQHEAVDQVTNVLPDEDDFLVWTNGADFDFGMKTPDPYSRWEQTGGSLGGNEQEEASRSLQRGQNNRLSF